MKESEYRLRLREMGNKEIILSSIEGYRTEEDCLKGIASIRKNSIHDDNYTRMVQSSNREYYFTLKGKNNELVAKSKGYFSKGDLEHAIENCKQVAPKAGVTRI